MATTTNLGLPLIDNNTTNDVKRDMNALAEAVDASVVAAIDGAIDDVSIPDASLTIKGKVQLSDVVSSTDKTKAATPSAVKIAYDEALAAKQLGVEQKNNVVAALNSIGVTASTSETWEQLIPKMAAVIRATGNATAAQVLSGATFSNATGNGLTGTMANRGAGGTVTPGTANQTKAAGYYSSAITILGDTDLIAANIKSGINIFGVLGNLPQRQFASGSAVMSDSNINFIVAVPGSNGTKSARYIEVSGLTFKPSLIVIYRNGLLSGLYQESFNSPYGEAAAFMYMAEHPTTNSYPTFSDLYPYYISTTRGNAYINSTGFRLPVLYDTPNNITYIAYG
ncbi:phage tail protein [Paenibacillus taichungensis]|uniref:phage tail protein n=1 Tax=Paenibacillus taichungensis TaxID=484184 RepID=UPI002DB9FC55|nr:phage tail protein [Paenibacillus taichungensis]MEC0107280.1 phage tail protein [Paenibacillus taichungensis]MEC0194788.1 phage tail protein [Paenibacillus taichungensis]